MEIIGHTIEKLEDPTGILSGDRYQFIITIAVAEDDEMYSEHGLYVKLIFVVENEQNRIAQYGIYEKETNKYIDFELEEEELTLIHDYCKNQIK